MNETPQRSRPLRAHQIANQLCGLVQQQIDILQRGLAEDGLQQYLERCSQIDELQAQLRTALHRQTM